MGAPLGGVAAVILAAGRSERLADPVPKPFRRVVVVHDAARPMVSPAFIDTVVAGVAEGFDGAISAVPIDDAIKEVAGGGEILAPRSRQGLWRAQTPQAFARECLETSLAKALAD